MHKGKDYFNVSSMVNEGKLIIPEFQLGKFPEYRSKRNGDALSAAGYIMKMQLPTSAEITHAFFGGSKDYRQSLINENWCAEYTSTLLLGNRTLIERPEKLICRNGVWIAKDGKRTKVNLPESGWVLEYDKPTGLPIRTSSYREKAEKIFGDDTSYFLHEKKEKKSLTVILRYFNIPYYGPFYLCADYELDFSSPSFAGRDCRRSEKEDTTIDESASKSKA